MRTVVGTPGALLPLLLAGWGVLVMAREPRPDVHSRWLVGAIVTGLGVLGLWHLGSGSPSDPEGVRGGAGVLGRIVGGTLEAGVSVFVAVPLLVLVVLFGVLVVIGRPAREIPGLVRGFFGWDGRADLGYDDEYWEDPDATTAYPLAELDEPAEEAPRSPRRSSRRRVAAWRKAPPGSPSIPTRWPP